MTKSKASLTRLVDSSSAMLLIPKEELTEKLIMRIKIGEEFLRRQIQTRSQLSITQKEYEIWNDQNSVLLKLAFNEPDNEYRAGYDYINIKGTFFRDAFIEEERDILFIDIRNKIEFLSQLVEKLPRIKYKQQKQAYRQTKKDEVFLNDKVEEKKEANQQAKKDEIFLDDKIEERKDAHQQTKKDEMTSNNKVFVVHGHNDEVKLNVVRTLEKLGIEPIILHEKGNEKNTLIELIENNSDVAFAIVLLSDDDVGKAQKDKELISRAGQNVILELGYFIGRLGIDRVCALHNNKIELPGDKHDLVYISVDPSGHWQIDLAKKLKSAGYKLDINNII
jgi:predicted nucleotide-binding protein